MTRLYLGTHQVSWLARPDMPPLFISANRLSGRKRLPRAAVPWALDSGGFTELRDHGRWRTTAAQYAATVRRLADGIGRLEWAAPQDWMVEPFMLAKTGLTVAGHQRLTVNNYTDLMALDPQLPVVPVLQGWTLDDYLRCADLYAAAGVDLAAAPVVGVGSVCRRQAGGQIATIVSTLAGHGIRLHGFGVKTGGLRRYADYLTSADSLAWSYGARRAGMDGITHPGCAHRSCANCPRWAKRWHTRLQSQLDSRPLALWGTA
jgi:hypothetical protein